MTGSGCNLGQQEASHSLSPYNMVLLPNARARNPLVLCTLSVGVKGERRGGEKKLSGVCSLFPEEKKASARTARLSEAVLAETCLQPEGRVGWSSSWRSCLARFGELPTERSGLKMPFSSDRPESPRGRHPCTCPAISLGSWGTAQVHESHGTDPSRSTCGPHFPLTWIPEPLPGVDGASQ